MATSPTTWNVMPQQVFFAQRDLTAGPGTSYSNDAWDGYVASRERISAGLVQRSVANPMVLTGDVHRHYAVELKAGYANPASPAIGSELVVVVDQHRRRRRTDAQPRARRPAGREPAHQVHEQSARLRALPGIA